MDDNRWKLEETQALEITSSFPLGLRKCERRNMFFSTRTRRNVTRIQQQPRSTNLTHYTHVQILLPNMKYRYFKDGHRPLERLYANARKRKLTQERLQHHLPRLTCVFQQS